MAPMIPATCLPDDGGVLGVSPKSTCKRLASLTRRRCDPHKGFAFANVRFRRSFDLDQSRFPDIHSELTFRVRSARDYHQSRYR